MGSQLVKGRGGVRGRLVRRWRGWIRCRMVWTFRGDGRHVWRLLGGALKARG